MDEPVYAKIGYSEAVQIRKEILKTEAEILATIKRLKEYRLLRKKEIMLKIKLKNEISEIKEAIFELLKEVPTTHKIEEAKKIQVQVKQKRDLKEDSDIESQLREIQRKLDELG
ncbi:MAG: hypothetical protein WC533_04810 [Candidatus Pacearchaeota archaeon]